jgi:hypothetical protein
VTEPGPYEHRDPAPRCSVPGCNHPSHLVTLWAGHRCRHHAPTWSPDVAARLVAGGWHGTAAAYARTYRQETS